MQETIRARVDSQLKEQFEFAAKSHGQNGSQLLRDFMADYVRRHKEQQIRREETLQAIESIEAGRHVAGDDVFAWMDTWGTDSTHGIMKGAPECK
jgi:predicted transcriptional regulator